MREQCKGAFVGLKRRNSVVENITSLHDVERMQVKRCHKGSYEVFEKTVSLDYGLLGIHVHLKPRSVVLVSEDVKDSPPVAFVET